MSDQENNMPAGTKTHEIPTVHQEESASEARSSEKATAEQASAVASTALATESVDVTTSAPKSHRIRNILIGSAGGVGAAIGLGLFFGNTSTEAEEKPEAPIIEQPATTPTPSISPGVTSSEEQTPETPKTARELIRSPLETPESVIEYGTFVNLSEGQQAWMRRVAAMTPEQYLNLSRDEQVSFGAQVFENMLVATQAALREHGVILRYTEDPQTSQEKVNNQILYWITAGWTYELPNNDYSNPPIFNEVASLSIIGLNRELDDYTLDLWRRQYAHPLSDYADRVVPSGLYEGMRRTIVDESPTATGEIVVTMEDPTGDYRQIIFAEEDVLAVPDTNNPQGEREVIGQNSYMKWSDADAEFEQ